jgi:hypothetical protein
MRLNKKEVLLVEYLVKTHVTRLTNMDQKVDREILKFHKKLKNLINEKGWW